MWRTLGGGALMSKKRQKPTRDNTRADAIAANVAPSQVSARWQSPREAAEAAAHASSAVAAQMRATDLGPESASNAVAQGKDQAGRKRAAQRGHAGSQEAAEGMAGESGLQDLATATDAPADATAAIEDGDPISWAARNFNLRS